MARGRTGLFSSPLLVGVFALGAVGLGFYLGRAPRAAAPAASAAAAAPTMRAEIARVISQEVTPLATEAEVRAYLEKLEARAKERGEVTALEVEPGVAAIARLTSLTAKERERMRTEFASKMSELSRELQSRRSNPKEKTP